MSKLSFKGTPLWGYTSYNIDYEKRKIEIDNQPLGKKIPSSVTHWIDYGAMISFGIMILVNIIAISLLLDIFIKVLMIPFFILWVIFITYYKLRPQCQKTRSLMMFFEESFNFIHRPKKFYIKINNHKKVAIYMRGYVKYDMDILGEVKHQLKNIEYKNDKALYINFKKPTKGLIILNIRPIKFKCIKRFKS